LFKIEDLSLAVICASDAFGRELLDQAVAKQIIAVTDCDMELPSHVSVLRVRAEDTGGEGIAVRFDGDFGSGVFQTRLVGHFNVVNLGLALAVLLGSGYSQTAVLPALEALTAPPGRMEMLEAANAPLVIVDYAHTPDALRQALIALRGTCRGALWCVFGCGGERDSGKRPLMAEAASDYADHIVITDDNPRTEDADHIVADIVAGMPDNVDYVIERDRRTAITHAIESSARGDCVLVAGKGHEDYQITGTERCHFSDRETVAQVLGIGLEVGL
jgi:UDP-N-acetylmuramoyl-L-alanyl-D-glutamate--2,6-diaminopimelate ligase